MINSTPKDLFNGRAEPVMIRTNSIYYGYRIPQEKYLKLHKIAVEKGLKEHFMIVNNAADDYKIQARNEPF